MTDDNDILKTFRRRFGRVRDSVTMQLIASAAAARLEELKKIEAAARIESNWRAIVAAGVGGKVFNMGEAKTAIGNISHNTGLRVVSIRPRRKEAKLENKYGFSLTFEYKHLGVFNLAERPQDDLRDAIMKERATKPPLEFLIDVPF